MQVLSRCPLEVASILWLPRPGAYTLTVVAKATFRIEPDVSPLAEEQDPVIEADSFWDEDEAKSLASATDLVPRKRHAEVLLVGHAYAPKGAAVGALVARLTVCEIDKMIEISGDRHFKLDGSLSHAGRFTKMPLRWERAAGGPETSNPVGLPMGVEARPDAWGRVAVPNLVQSGRIVASREDIVPPACFAPIAPTWPTRVTRLNRYAASFAANGWHARPMPPDLDMAYFNAAPQDQFVRELLGTERFTLENLHARHPLLTTRLANVAPRATVDWGGGNTYDLPLACDTLLIDTDRGVATVTFRGLLPLDYPERQGWVIVTSDAVPTAELPAWIHSVKDVEGTAAFPDEAASDALPFDAETSQFKAASHLQIESPPTAQLPYEQARSLIEAPETAMLYEGAGATAHLPFDARRASVPAVELDARRASVPAVEEVAPAGGDYDEEETFASVRGDAPFPVIAGAARAGTSTSEPRAASVPMVPPKVPLGPRLGAFRLQAKSDAPPAASSAAEEARARSAPTIGADIEDEPTGDPDAARDDEDASITGTIAAVAPRIVASPPFVRGGAPGSSPPPAEADGALPFRRAGTVPMPEAMDRAPAAGLPFSKAPPGKVLQGKAPPGKIAPMTPGVPPPPPSSAGRAQPLGVPPPPPSNAGRAQPLGVPPPPPSNAGRVQPLGVPPPPPSNAGRAPPTFGFQRRNTMTAVATDPAMPFGRAPSLSETGPYAARTDAAPEPATPFERAQALSETGPYAAPADAAPEPATPFKRAQTLPTPGLYPAPAMPFGPATGDAPAAAEPAFTSPAAHASVSAAETLPGPMSFASLLAGPPAATPFASTPGATPFTPAASATPFAPPPTFGAPATPPPPAPATFGAPTATPATFGAPLGVLASGQGMTIGEMIPAARASSAGKTIGEMVAESRLPIEAPRPEIEAPRPEIEEPGTFEPESTKDTALPQEAAGPVEPPRIGPLATPEMVAADLGLPNEPPAEEAPPKEAAPAPPPAPAEPPPLPLEAYPLERCARIAASIARSRDRKDEILEAQKLDEARWEPLRAHWLDEIKKETERGKTEKLRAYDVAFVAQLEDERGPIAVEEYARIVISAERGTTNQTLADLKLPEGSMLRIQRVWMARMGKDPELRRLVRSAVEIASES